MTDRPNIPPEPIPPKPPPPPVSIQLDVPWQQQQQSNWCWAAVSSMISNFYQDVPTLTQCSVATATINEWQQAHNEPPVNCCDPSVASSQCNTSWGLQPPLEVVGNYASMTWSSIPLSEVEAQLTAGTPICIQVAWSGGGAHVLIIDGVIESETAYIHVEDPAYGPGDYPYTTVLNDYQSSGTWYGTFLTEQQVLIL
jgi:hypothetical protein